MIQGIFEDNRALFYGEVLQCVIRLRNMVEDFGILPFPKWDAAQDRYYHHVVETACMVGVPISLTGDRLEMVGYILEAMCAKSKYTLQPAYYEKALVYKNVRDTESEEMLNIILKSRMFDIGYIADWGTIYSSTYQKSVVDEKNNFVSAYEKAESRAKTAMGKDLDKIESY